MLPSPCSSFPEHFCCSCLNGSLQLTLEFQLKPWLFFSSHLIPPLAAISDRGPLQHGQVMHPQTNGRDLVALAVCLLALGIIEAFECLSPAGHFLSISGLCQSVRRWFGDGFVFLIKVISSLNTRMEIVT